MRYAFPVAAARPVKQQEYCGPHTQTRSDEGRREDGSVVRFTSDQEPKDTSGLSSAKTAKRTPLAR